MSHYARNHLQDDWASPAREQVALRVQAAEREASWYFDQATRHAKAEFDGTMQALSGVTSPRANRARDHARARWREKTAGARTLLEATIECLLTTGEVSAGLDEQWTALIDRDAQMKDAAG